MANAKHSATTCENAPPVIERELQISIYPDEWANYEGTRAQLEDEGLVPKGFEWPRAAADKRWSAGRFEYWLRRQRPEGFKGPLRQWLECDWWFVRVTVIGRDTRWRGQREIERKRKALEAEIYRQSPEGMRDRDANWKRYWAAHEDKVFQAFKATFIPQRKKPGRPPKVRPDAASES